MLYAISNGRVQGYTRGQAEVVHLVFRLEQLAVDGKFVMTNGDAIMAITRVDESVSVRVQEVLPADMLDLRHRHKPSSTSRARRQQ